jgi:uncharacterized protein YjbJ (UPF0337 family)
MSSEGRKNDNDIANVEGESKETLGNLQGDHSKV